MTVRILGEKHANLLTSAASALDQSKRRFGNYEVTVQTRYILHFLLEYNFQILLIFSPNNTIFKVQNISLKK